MSRTSFFSASFTLPTLFLATLSLVPACGGSDSDGGRLSNGSENGSGGAPIVIGGGSGGSGTGEERELKCDENGENCTCVNIAIFGAQGNYGAVPGSDGQSAIQAWLNEKSSATVAAYPAKPALTEDFFAAVDIIILENLNGWSFSADETAAFEAWVNGGGGVISLSGYTDQSTEAGPTNQLLAFSGLQYAGVSAAGDTASPDWMSGSCAYCLGNSYAQAGWVASHPIAANLTAVGAFWGRSIAVSGAGEVVAEERGKVLGATAQVGEGRVFMFHDEWVTYNSQWYGASLTDDCRTVDVNHACYNVHPATTYNVPQFWYNALLFASGNATCFNIVDQQIIK